MSKDTGTFSVSAAKALFEAAKKPEAAKNVAQDERARGAVLNAVKDPSGSNKFSAAVAVADANRRADVPPPPPHRAGAVSSYSESKSSPGKLSSAHSAIRSQLENLHIGGSSSNAPATSPSYQPTASSVSPSYRSTYNPPAATSYSSAPAPPPVPRHNSSVPSYTTTPNITTPHGIAVFEYTPSLPDEMALRVGDTVLLSKKVDDQWLYGENQNTRSFGIIPVSYLDIKIPLKEAFSAPPSRPSAPSGSSGAIATALYDYNSAEIGDLSFSAGSQITVLFRVNAEWLEGECYGRTGIFPSQFVTCPNLSQVPSKQPAPSPISPPKTSGSKQIVTVTYDYDSGVATDLRLYEGDVITVLEDIDGQWLFAECRGQQGMVPKTFLGPPYGSPKKANKGIAEIASAFSPKKAMATGDYHSEDPKHLYVTRGDTLLIVEDVDDYYFKGKLEAFKTLPAGILPKNIVKFTD
ncbi:unnamed protein product [Caenorhabditis sp. 36 PRJEB53466]|nr:unnamed protein product [Caenorhabditis sp. 36 PRJEB53466]